MGAMVETDAMNKTGETLDVAATNTKSVMNTMGLKVPVAVGGKGFHGQR
jgi:hypothetical protein